MAARVDLNGIKERVQTLLDSCNTTTGSPIDLSSGLANSVRVLNVLKVHPEMIIPTAEKFPLVTCYVSNKDIDRTLIAGNQLNPQRKGTVELTIVGSIWNNNFQTVDEDPADEDINYLMENIELIMRSDPSLNGKVSWQHPTGCKFYTSALDNQTHLRSGVMTFDCQVFY